VFIATELGRQKMVWTPDLQDKFLADTVGTFWGHYRGDHSCRLTAHQQFGRSGPLWATFESLSLAVSARHVPTGRLRGGSVS
jgi:hypothetical protein